MEKRTASSGFDAASIIDAARNIRDSPPESDKPSVIQPEPEPSVVAAPKEDNRRRKGKGVDYEALFFKEAQVKTRSGKVAYIRKEYHDRMMKILRMIGDNEITLFNYLDNVLEHHFNVFQDDITDLYRKKNTDEYLNP